MLVGLELKLKRPYAYRIATILSITPITMKGRNRKPERFGEGEGGNSNSAAEASS